MIDVLNPGWNNTTVIDPLLPRLYDLKVIGIPARRSASLAGPARNLIRYSSLSVIAHLDRGLMVTIDMIVTAGHLQLKVEDIERKGAPAITLHPRSSLSVIVPQVRTAMLANAMNAWTGNHQIPVQGFVWKGMPLRH